MKRRLTLPNIAAVIVIIACVMAISFGYCLYINLDDRLCVLENQLTQTSPTDMQLAIDFMKDQMQILTWILGVILSIAGVGFSFFGWATRESVKEKFEAMYKKQLAEKEDRVLKKQIVFICQKKDAILTQFIDEILNEGYNAKAIRASTNKEALSKLGRASIAVYHMTDKDDTLYEVIAEWCEEKHVHCILYCPPKTLPTEFLDKKWSYMSSSNQIAKLRESLYTLLYLAP